MFQHLPPSLFLQVDAELRADGPGCSPTVEFKSSPAFLELKADSSEVYECFRTVLGGSFVVSTSVDGICSMIMLMCQNGRKYERNYRFIMMKRFGPLMKRFLLLLWNEKILAPVMA